MGASRQMLGILNQAGLSISYQAIAGAIEVLGTGCIETAKLVADGPHALCYDNIQTSTSIFVEQTLDTRAKVQSGTVSLIYKLPNATAEDMILAPLVEQERSSRLLSLGNLRPSYESLKAYTRQSQVHIVKVLLAYIDGFSGYKGNSLLEHQPRRRVSIPGKKTEFYPLRATTIEEATALGNKLVHDDVYLVQLEKTPEALENRAIVTIGDQMTNSRFRTVKEIVKHDLTDFDRRSGFQIGVALFHLCLNAVWVLKTVHYGVLQELGSLADAFTALGKVRLANAKPDYHALETALSQVVDGLLLNAWERECGDLDAFARTKPSAEALLGYAAKIRAKYATPTNEPPRAQKAKLSKEEQKASREAKEAAKKSGVKQPRSATTNEFIQDPVHENVLRLTRDLLLVKEVVSAIKDGDIGRVEDILIDFAMLFRGAGSNNYSTEILHLLRNLKLVWTPQFADIMRDTMLVNISGLPGRFMGIDLNIEHCIRYLKTLFASKGISGNWERCGNLSASINNLMSLKRRVTRSLQIAYQGSRHTNNDKDARAVVLRMAEKAKEWKLHEIIPGRQAVLRPDLRAVGQHRMETTGLALFNKKIENQRSGLWLHDEEDEISAPDFAEQQFESLDDMGDIAFGLESD